MKSPRKPTPPACPWDPVGLEPHELSAIKSIPDATLAVIDKLCATDRMSFAPGGEEGRRASDFAEGKRWVGLTLRGIRAMKMPGPPIPPARGAQGRAAEGLNRDAARPSLRPAKSQ